MTVEELLNEMKEKGIGGAIVRTDGVPIASTIALKDVDAGLFASVANVSDALLKRVGDKPEEMEAFVGGLLLVMVPLKNHIFCGLIKNREDKPAVLEYAQKAQALL